MNKTLGQKIRELREAKDLSLREFAKLLEAYTPAFLSDIELGRRYPSEEALVKMARVLGISVEALKEFDTRPPVEELKRLAALDPTFGIALRKVIEQKVSAEELMKLAKKAEDKGKEK